MNGIALGFLIASAIIGIIVLFYVRFQASWQTDRTWRNGIADGAWITAILATLVLVVWFVVAIPVSSLNKSNCKREASGYGLDYDWSIRNGCRIMLPTGQLVPSDKIRITSDGDIITGEDD